MNGADIPNFTQSASRRASRIAAVGALIVIISFVCVLWQLHNFELQLERKRAELQWSKAQLTSIQKEATNLSNEVINLKIQLRNFRQLNQKFDEAIRPQTDRNYRVSAEKLLEVVKADPNNEVALYWLSHAYSKLGKYPEAIDAASKAIKLDPNYVDPYLVMVWSLHFSGRQAQAADYLRSGLNISIDAYGYFWGRKREIDELWKVKTYLDIFYAHEKTLRTIQILLAEKGLYSGRVDGMVGSGTRTALAKFYAAQSITNSLPVKTLVQRLQASNR